MPSDASAASAGTGHWRVWPRFAAALIVSALLHAALTDILTAGSAVRTQAPAAVPMSVRLLVVHEPLPAVPLEKPNATRKPALVAPAKRIPSPAVPAGRAASAKDQHENGSVAEPADTTYYAARQLDRYPELTAALELRFPSGVAASEHSGYVLLLVLIDAEGRVNDATVLEAAPAGVFDDEAKRALLNARFKPALKDGRAVRSRLVVHVSYGSA